MEIEYTENLSEKIQDFVDDSFDKYAKSRGVILNYREFAFLMRDENKKLIGALIGYSIHEEVFIEDLWVHENYRCKGYGRNLMETAEKKFKNEGFNYINLTTNEFQAPYLYPRLGYELEFIRKNKKNPKLSKYFFIKRF